MRSVGLLLLAFPVGCLYDHDAYDRRKAELTDHDGDTFAQLDDCDDSDGTIFPGAEEMCDGADQDCDGEVDEGASDAVAWYPDADADGHGVAAGVIFACESPGSGFVGVADDCDDTNSGALPGASEIAYDGVDQDCDGADLDDLDGDGWTSEVTGGGDCDDADAEVNPDVGETWANGFTDNDCDGEIEAIQLDYGASSWAGWRAGDGLGRRVAATGDLDSDGLADVVIASDIDSTLGPLSGALYRVDGLSGGSLEGAAALYPNEAGQYFGAGLDAGTDVTGDGIGDLVVTAIGSASSLGRGWIVDGAAWVAAGSSSVDAVAAGAITANSLGTSGPAAARFVGDVNGDGVEDVAFGECCSDGGLPGSVGRVAIFSSDAFFGTLDEADVNIEGPWANAYFGLALDRIGDEDGDGLSELLVSSLGGLTTAVLPGTRSGMALDLATTVIYGEQSGPFGRNVGDVDGDGRDDVAVVGVEDIVTFFTALNAAPSRVLEAPTFSFSTPEHGGVFDVLPLGDRDEDGRSDVLIPQAWTDSGTEHLWILPGEAIAAGAATSGDEMVLSGVSSVPAALFGYAIALAGDVDGDGRDDVVLGAPDYSAGGVNAGGATLISVPE